jgi:DNA repair protein RadC
MTRSPTGSDLREATDEEVLAALLGPITTDSLDRARHLLDRVGGYPAISRTTTRELMVAEGVGPATATRIQAAIEAGRRALATPLDRGTPITSARQVHQTFVPRFADAEQEEFVVALLDRKHRLLRVVDVSRGTLDSCIVHPREVFREAIREAACSVLCVHNHPSGDPTPSEEDECLTCRLAAAAELLGVELLDHVIVCRGGYHSFRDTGDL